MRYFLILSSILVFISLFFYSANALQDIETLNIYFELQDDAIVKETLNYTFTKAMEEEMFYTIDQEITNVKVYGNGEELFFTQTSNSNGTIIGIKPLVPLENISLEFMLLDSIYEKNSNTKHFFTYISLDQQPQKISAEFKVPKDISIPQQTLLPEEGYLTTDGETISVKWDSIDDADFIFSVDYKENYNYLLLILGGIFSITLISIFCFYIYKKKEHETDFMFGFSEDEKKALEYIKDHKKILQRDLHRTFHFSRAKTTRMIKKFEEKQIIEKEEWGRNNRVYWKDPNFARKNLQNLGKNLQESLDVQKQK